MVQITTVPAPPKAQSPSPRWRPLGPLCLYGHERAVHERLYKRKGKAYPTRLCLACVRERDAQKRAEHKAEVAAIEAARPLHDQLWDEFCRTVEDRIAYMRGQTRRCTTCDETKDIEAFARDRGKPFGRGYQCLACKRSYNAVTNLNRKRKAWRGETVKAP